MMGRVTISKNCGEDSTYVSNIFIDEYMQEANGTEIKVYLFLLRMMSSNLPTSVPALADKFNQTESDVIRSLKYWEKKGLISLEYDVSQNLTGIHMEDIIAQSRRKYGRRKGDTVPGAHPHAPLADHVAELPPQIHPVQDISPLRDVAPMQDSAPLRDVETLRDSAPLRNMAPLRDASPVQDVAPIRNIAPQEPVPERPNYSASQLKSFKQSKGSNLLFIAEQYFGRTLNTNEMSIVYYIHDELGFSDDLLDYLMQYCVDNHKKDFRYMEKVAINWNQTGIKTPKQARAEIIKHDSDILTIMKALGMENSPTEKEASFFTSWRGELGFSMEIILEACDRTVMATQKNRIRYCDKILHSWHESNVSSREDIARLDAEHFTADLAKKRSRASVATIDTRLRSSESSIRLGGPQNRFNQFQQNTYDFTELEKKLLDN